jgi:hypothetical protein
MLIHVTRIILNKLISNDIKIYGEVLGSVENKCILEMSNISKSFPGVKALEKVMPESRR